MPIHISKRRGIKVFLMVPKPEIKYELQNSETIAVQRKTPFRSIQREITCGGITTSEGVSMKSLGLDLSCSTCGFAITEDKKIVDVGYFDISKVEKYKDKAQIIIDGLVGKEFGRINVEENLSGFAFGKTSQQTILKLAKNKAVICYILEEYYHLPMVYANAVTMRKQLFGVSRIKGIKPKDFVKQKIETMYNITPWIVLNRNGVPDRRMEDAYDAIVASCYEKHHGNL